MSQILLCDWLFGWTARKQKSMICLFGISYILVCTIYCWFDITLAVKSSLFVSCCFTPDKNTETGVYSLVITMLANVLKCRIYHLKSFRFPRQTFSISVSLCFVHCDWPI